MAEEERRKEDRGPAGEGRGAPAPAIDPRLLDLLVCPLTRGVLVYDRVRGELVSRKARLAFPIREGIPVMLADLARPLDDDETARL